MEESTSRVFANKIFVYGVYRIPIEEIKVHFENFGPVKNVELLKNNEGFAFVEFFNNVAVQNALQTENQFIRTQKIKVKEAYQREIDRQNSQNINSGIDHINTAARNKIFVGGLPPATTEEELLAYFGSFGTVTNIVVMRYPSTNISKGFGFVTFDSIDAARNVLRTRFHCLNGKLVEAKVAVPGRSINQMSISQYHTDYVHQAYFDGYVPQTNAYIPWSNHSSYINRLHQTTVNIPWINHCNYVNSFYTNGPYHGYVDPRQSNIFAFAYLPTYHGYVDRICFFFNNNIVCIKPWNLLS